jgi:hypothetical protein
MSRRSAATATMATLPSSAIVTDVDTHCRGRAFGRAPARSA